MKNNQNNYLKQIRLHLMDITSGNCAITDEVILTEKNDEFKDILAGLRLLHEDHQFSLKEITNANKEGKSRTDSLLDSILSLAMLDYSAKAYVSEKRNVFDALAIGVNMLGEELQASTYSRLYLDSIFHTVSGILIVTDENWRITKVNSATEVLLGYNEGELLDEHISKLINVGSSDNMFFNRIRRKEAQNYDEVISTKSGKQVEVRLSAALISEVDNKFGGWVLAGQDVSELRMVHRKLRVQHDRMSDIMDNVNQIIYTETFDEKGKAHLEYVSKSVESILGYTVDEFMHRSRKNIRGRYHPDDVAHIKEQLSILKQKSESVVITYRSLHNQTNKYVWLEDRVVPKFDDEGNIKGVFGSTSDISARKEAEENSERFKLVMDSAGDSFYLIDPDKNDAIIDVNLSAIRGLGYTREEFLKMSTKEVEVGLSHKSRHKRNQLVMRNSKTNHQTLFQGIHKRKDTTTFPVEISVMVRNIAGKDYQLAAVRDISERISIERDLEISALKYKSITDTAQDAIITIDRKGSIVLWNKAAKKMFGFSFKEMLGKKINRIIPSKYKQDHRKGFKRYMESGKSNVMNKTVELEGLRKNGTVFPLELSLSGWKVGEEQFFTGIIKDVTDRKEAIQDLRQSERRYRRFIEQSKDMIYSFEANTGSVMQANPAFHNMLGYSAAESAKLNIYDIVSDSKKNIDTNIKSIRLLGSKSFGERKWKCKNGDLLDVMISISLVEEGKKQIYYVIGHDITQRNKDRDDIRKALDEKSILLKEVHHRVKNNLQVISSLLDLQANSLDDGTVLEKLKESQHRVKSMALVHEKLYNTTELKGIELGEYTRDLADFLLAAYIKGRGNIELQVNSDIIQVSISTAIPCGLIINEILSNSLKHAFPEGQAGVIKVRITVKRGLVQLSIQDNGVGIDSELNLEQASTLGLKLISILTKQLSGKVEMKNNNGVKYEISFRQPIQNK